ncbi:MAG: hypothetical protein KKB30_14530 [Proteobacteria bacterium]|nr:hypothetical protein [Pseudomonadota bacterium]MBU1715558.1 hypothetical protein [Pseudomonadota bacterium]
MPAIRILIYGMLALILSGCGQVVTEKLSVQQSAANLPCPTSKKIVVLPFADYSYSEDVTIAQNRSLAIMEVLTDQLVANGFRLPVQEDTMRYLADNQIIKTNSFNNELNNKRSLQRELDGAWSSLMREEIAKLIAAEQRVTKTEQNKGTALNKQTLAKIGADFRADYILRGRLIKFDLQQEHTWNPMKKGILPVIFDGTNRTFFGVAKSETYDTIDSMAVGAAIGSIFGDSANSPYTTADKVNPSGANSTVWGLAGAGAAYLASQGGVTNQAAVELRIWIQDPETSEVIWTNRVHVLVSPQTMFADSNKDKLFDTAVTQAVTALVQDLVAKTKL